MTKARKLTKGGDRKYRKWQNWSEGDRMGGTITRLFEDRYGKTGWEIKIEMCDFEDEDSNFEVDDIVGVNGCTVLSARMDELGYEIGDYFEFELEGFKPITQGPYKGKDLIMVVPYKDESVAEIPDPASKKSRL